MLPTVTSNGSSTISQGKIRNNPGCQISGPLLCLSYVRQQNGQRRNQNNQNVLGFSSSGTGAGAGAGAGAGVNY